MKLLVVLRNCWYIRNFERSLRTLLERGHTLEVWFLHHKKNVPRDPIERLAKDFPDTLIYDPENKPPRKDELAKAARKGRKSRNYIRYLADTYKDAPKLAERAERGVPSHVLFFSKNIPLLKIGAIRNAYDAKLAQFEKDLPADPAIVELIKSSKADTLMVSPLVDHDSNEVDYLKAAQELKLPTCLCVASWDNLTNKGRILVEPDVVTVWNKHMKQEAIDLHQIPSEKIKITGAQIFDAWFERIPSRTREDFCKELGFDPEQKIFLYLCSSPFIAGDERAFIEEWRQSVRASSDDRLQNANLLVRPHPLNAKQWDDFKSPEAKLRVWPKAGEHPVNEDARANYFDSLHFSETITGINTSGLIEAAIVGRACLSILTEKYEKTQTGTLHFQHLAAGGFLHISRNWSAYLKDLVKVLETPDRTAQACENFVKDFVRPNSLLEPCSPQLADVLEKLGQ